MVDLDKEIFPPKKLLPEKRLKYNFSKSITSEEQRSMDPSIKQHGHVVDFFVYRSDPVTYRI